MMAIVSLPAPLQRFAADNDFVEVEGTTAGEVLDHLFEKYYQLRKFICSDDGSIRSTINIYLNGRDIKFLSNEELRIGESDQIKIIPTIAGGQD